MKMVTKGTVRKQAPLQMTKTSSWISSWGHMDMGLDSLLLKPRGL